MAASIANAKLRQAVGELIVLGLAKCCKIDLAIQDLFQSCVLLQCEVEHAPEQEHMYAVPRKYV